MALKRADVNYTSASSVYAVLTTGLSLGAARRVRLRATLRRDLRPRRRETRRRRLIFFPARLAPRLRRLLLLLGLRDRRRRVLRRERRLRLRRLAALRPFRLRARRAFPRRGRLAKRETLKRPLERMTRRARIALFIIPTVTFLLVLMYRWIDFKLEPLLFLRAAMALTTR